MVFFFCLLLLIAVPSVWAMASRAAGRFSYWAAMGSNGLATLACIALVLVRGSDPGFALVLVLPTLLNLVTVDQLRRARGAAPEG